ncbi:MAG TPA: DUF2232 domain-containing protein [bacterium]|nr:DUF2232 domain-containing protein [bacterium]
MALPILGLLLDLALVTVILLVAGVTAVWALLKGMSSRGVVLVSALAAFAFLGAYFAVILPGFHEFFTEALKAYEAVWTAQTPSLLKSGASQENIDLFKAFALKYFLYAFPAWVAVGSLTAGLVSYYLASALLRRVTARVQRPMPFRLWVLPDVMVFGFIAGCFLKLFGPENSAWDVVGDNLVVFFAVFYTLGGLSIVSFFLNKWGLTVFWRVVVYILMLQLSLEVMVPVASLGLMDLWFDFRKLRAAPAPGGKP